MFQRFGKDYKELEKPAKRIAVNKKEKQNLIIKNKIDETL